MILLLEQFLYQKNCYFNVRRYSWIHTFIAKLSDRCFCWFRRHVQMPIRIDTNQLASPQKSLWIMKNCTDQSKGLRWCGFVRFLVRFCGNIYVKLRYYDFTKPSGLRVIISMRFAVFLCYSVRFCDMRTPPSPPTHIPFKKFPGNAPGPPFFSPKG